MSDPALAGVTVLPENGDLFSLTKQMIARSGQIAYKIDAFESQLAALRLELEAWALHRAKVVDEAFLVLKGEHFLFLVVLKGTAYDGAFEDDLTELDIRVAQNPDYDLINLSVLALPAFAEDVIRSFLPQRAEDAQSDAERAESPVAGQS